MYKKVELKENGFVGMEQEVQELWKEKDIVHKNFDMITLNNYSNINKQTGIW